MDNTTTKSNTLSSVHFIGIWTVYTTVYCLLKTYCPEKAYIGLLLTSSDTTLNITMICYMTWLWKHAVKEAKRPFGFFALSFSCVTIPNAIYQILFNILHLKNSYFSIDSMQLIIHHVTYAACLIFEFAAWTSIVIYVLASKPKTKAYGTIALIIAGTALLSAFAWKTTYADLPTTEKYFKLYITNFYIINFTLAALCLAFCKNRSLFYLSMGYLTIIGADLIMAFGIMSQHLGTGSVFDTSWCLGLLLMVYGCLCFKQSRDYKLTPFNWLFRPNSIKIQSAIWGLIPCTISLWMFLASTNYINSCFFQNNLARFLVSVLIVYIILTTAISNFFTKKYYLPLARIENQIKDFIGHFGITNNQTSATVTVTNNNCVYDKIFELKPIENFLHKAFQLAQEKRAAEQELIQVAAQAAHDICSPIMALDIALKRIPNMTPEQSNCVKNIEKSITNIAKGLMQKYRTIQNKEKFVPASLKHMQLMPTSMATLLNITFDEKNLLLSETTINFTKHIQEEARALKTIIDPSFMHRILSNIINNAVDAIEVAQLQPHSGNITLALDKQDDDFIRITISDNGCGMSPELVEKINKGEVVTEKKDGHGIGLSSAIQFILAWHGKYSIETQPGEGTRFIIYLPIAEVS